MSEDFSSQLKRGDRFAAYTIGDVIGIGGMSEVYKATHTFLGHTVALKISKIQQAQDPHLRELATGEALALARLRHANLVPVVDAGVTEQGLVWMAMPLLEGLTLRDYLTSMRPTELDCLRIARDICDGVAAAHQMRITHRDLKPENVFITTKREVIVLDFGMAKFHDMGLRSTGKGRTGGTFRYMSPEHCHGEKVDARTDQYAIGVMLYEMLSGEHPFERGEDGELLTPGQIVAAHMTRDPAPLATRLRGCPPEISEIVRRAMEKDRNRRFGSAVEMARAIRDAMKKIRHEEPVPRSSMSVTPSPGASRAYAPPQRPIQYDTEPLPPSQRVITPAAGAVSRSSAHATTEPAARRASSPAPVVAQGNAPPHAPKLDRRSLDGTPAPTQSPITPLGRTSSRAIFGALAIAAGVILAIGIQIALHHGEGGAKASAPPEPAASAETHGTGANEAINEATSASPSAEIAPTAAIASPTAKDGAASASPSPPRSTARPIAAPASSSSRVKLALAPSSSPSASVAAPMTTAASSVRPAPTFTPPFDFSK